MHRVSLAIRTHNTHTRARVRGSQVVDAKAERFVEACEETKGCIIKTAMKRESINGTAFTNGDMALVCLSRPLLLW